MDFGFVCDAFGNVTCVLKEGMDHRSGVIEFPRQFIGLFHLRQNLGLADDQTIQAGCDREEMEYGVAVGMQNRMIAESSDVESMKIGNEGHHRFV